MNRLAVGLAAVVVAMLTLTGCAPPILDPVPAPVTVELDELAGQTVDVPLDSLLNINVDGFDVTSVTAVIDDPDIAEFVPGSDDGSAQFNPGVRPLAVGQTSVTLTHDEDAFDPVEFVLNVTR
ncbi:hypothetical protein [Pseudolysinimonas yzui]|uniref:Uncharacterized protein n=1 Tax=Pseudolysinimonas yzui TaxID=2708254 RepID=A0A8J3GN26_9MICO|nr:hypothetical protein [Pseudolysinimonas yzui]GHF05712.1 hypothetical protein GCM10011600_02810 [Pseudolysinimonas yzui]